LNLESRFAVIFPVVSFLDCFGNVKVYFTSKYIYFNFNLIERGRESDLNRESERKTALLILNTSIAL
jgi:hypothetical protein